jgi:hypothetical protein
LDITGIQAKSYINEYGNLPFEGDAVTKALSEKECNLIAGVNKWHTVYLITFEW